jgi:hypothetical protein
VGVPEHPPFPLPPPQPNVSPAYTDTVTSPASTPVTITDVTTDANASLFTLPGTPDRSDLNCARTTDDTLFLSPTATATVFAAGITPPTDTNIATVAAALTTCSHNTQCLFADALNTTSANDLCKTSHYNHDTSLATTAALILLAAATNTNESIRLAATAAGVTAQPTLYLDGNEPLTFFSSPACHARGIGQQPTNPWDHEPRTYTEALRSPWRKEWEASAHLEMNRHKTLGTWKLTPVSDVPPGHKIINTRLFGKVKRDAKGNVAKFKSRLVARGDQAEEFQHYHQKSSPVPTSAALRCLLSIAASTGLVLTQFDIQTAFLEEKLDVDNVYLQLPQQFRTWRYPDGVDRPTATHNGVIGVQLVGQCLLGLYGLPQACRLFTKGFATFCTSAGLEQSDMEPCLWTQTKKRYSYTYPNGRTTYTATDEHDGMTGVEVEPYRIFLLHHVDDILCASSANNPFYDKFVTDLNTRYSTTGGNSTDIFFLNQEINVSETGIQLSQKAHVRQLIDNVLGPGVKPSTEKTPLPTNFVATKADCPQTELEQKQNLDIRQKYQSALGQCLWLSTQTRCDISYAVSVLGRFSHNPSKEAWNALRHLCRYLASTDDLCLQWDRFVEPTLQDQLVSYADSDFGGCPDTARSTSGFVCMLNGGPIAWSAKRQVLVDTSTCEAELISLCSASLTTVYLRRLLESFGIHQQGPTVIEEDNQPAIAVAESDMQSQRTRHIARRYFKVRELINGTGHGTAEYDAPSIRVRYVRSEKNLSDAFTKPLPEVTLLRLRSQLLKPRNF